jgi:peroxiredoxin
MAATSTMLALGSPLPEFILADVTTKQLISSRQLAGSPVVVAVLCNHCPYVKHVRAELARLGSYAQEKAVRMVAISANDVQSHPEDGPEKMAEEARNAGYTFPYLYDEPQTVVKALKAVCTPEFYLFDRDGKLAYRGRLDESNPRNGVAPTGRELRAAIDAVVAGSEPNPDQKPSIGCSIKWKPGNEPSYL